MAGQPFVTIDLRIGDLYPDLFQKRQQCGLSPLAALWRERPVQLRRSRVAGCAQGGQSQLRFDLAAAGAHELADGGHPARTRRARLGACVDWTTTALQRRRVPRRTDE